MPWDLPRSADRDSSPATSPHPRVTSFDADPLRHHPVTSFYGPPSHNDRRLSVRSHHIQIFIYYIRQVNGVKLADILSSLLCCLSVCLSVCLCALSPVLKWQIYAFSERLLVSINKFMQGTQAVKSSIRIDVSDERVQNKDIVTVNDYLEVIHGLWKDAMTSDLE